MFHLPLGVCRFFPDSTATAVFTSLRLMIKLLLKTVYTSTSSRGPLSVDTCTRREGEERGGRLAPVTQGGVGLFLGSVIPRGPSGHMVRKLVDSTNVCLKRQGRTPCWVSHRILYKPGGLFWEQERGERVQLIWARLWCQSRHVILKAYVHRPTSTVPVLLTHS